MVAQVETTRAETFLYGLLAGDPQLRAVVADRIYSYIAPVGGALPAVVFQQQTGTDLRAPGPVRIWSNMLYLVRAIAQGATWGQLEAAAARIDALLQGAQGSAGPGQVYICYREQPYTLVESDAGVQYRHLGGLYRLYVAPE